MNARASFSSTRAKSAHAAERLLPIFHPLWSSADDHFILTQRASGVALHRIAIGLMRDRVAVEQRWHRLRVIPGIEDLLKAYGLSRSPYPALGSRDG